VKFVTLLAFLLALQLPIAPKIAEDKGGKFGHIGANSVSRTHGGFGFSPRNRPR
jgi:hypothetical protein